MALKKAIVFFCHRLLYALGHREAEGTLLGSFVTCEGACRDEKRIERRRSQENVVQGLPDLRARVLSHT